ncbi:iron-containing alcohol dehydrogenase [Notoacmeibacter sp. MSK16QG-6]|uniref:iron-containing alcohol dehydrogenase n=1 Tax=Notoacmeibacter sp. MSK16QG-6 TaxID=2957982 RepID=UPI00209CCA37|nr:iron-containing alcohol dehydrogenase [Notoacmeibacter sp. MSK16QG-6]MCP1200844.1 iron-containing alcohol dehydrogenase [Notoacmeibacter sp. MSK16QG-6]
MYNLTTPVELRRPALVHYGSGALAKLADWVAASGFKAPFVVADPINAVRLSLLGLGEVNCFGDVVPEPGSDNLEDAVSAAKGADVVIGFGGGSAMDLAKLVAVMVDQPVELSDISGANKAPARKVGLAQIPTTAGTGSEVGTRALVTDPETNSKVATESPYMLADIAIIDPDLTMTVPPHITAATGVDAMAHCVEAFTSKRSHPLIDDYALRGIQLVGRYLQRAVKNGNDAEARAGLSLAAFYGGICLGPVNTTAGHALSYPLGTQYKLPHGIANALIFPHVLAKNAEACAEQTAAIAQALGFRGGDSAEILAGATAFCKSLGLDMRLRAYGVKEDSLRAMAEEAHAIRRLLDWNPRELSVDDIEALYRQAY